MSDQKNSMGMDEKTASWFAYILSIISAIILLVTEKDNKTVRTHAWQSLFLGCLLAAIIIVFGIFAAIIGWGAWLVFAWLDNIAWIAWLVVTIICIVKAVQGDVFKIPVIYNKAVNMK